ncbi:MAG TPA: NUDIX hydrolase [Myxococcota bacterium]|jgi:phosphatase NudJ
MSREPIPMFCFALVVVRRGAQFLLVHERKHGQGWYLPAGRVEPGETFAEGAIRETKEEAGIDIALDGVLKVQHTPSPSGARMRVFFLAHQLGDAAPKSTPDEHSLEAAWFTPSEVKHLDLRGDEVEQWISYVDQGAVAAPLSIFALEVP